MSVPLKNAVLQSNLDAGGFTILDLDLSGLNLNKTSVGLGNVDNTSDLLKPLSTATIAALALKEPVIAAGTAGQFWDGTKNWVTYGPLALLGGETGLSVLASRAASATTGGLVRAERNDFEFSGVFTMIQQFGASASGTVLATIPNANAGVLEFRNDAYGVIKTNNNVPIIFGTNNTKRMRLTQGLNVGGDTDPGAGCISASGTITGVTVAATTVNATTLSGGMAHPTITGEGGLGYISFPAQSSAPTGLSQVSLYATSAGRLGILNSGSAAQTIEFDDALLTAKRTYNFPNVSGTLAVGTLDTGWTAWTGTGSKATKLVSTATTAECAAAIKSVIDALIAWKIIGT